MFKLTLMILLSLLVLTECLLQIVNKAAEKFIQIRWNLISFEAEVDDNDVVNDNFELEDVGNEEDKKFVDDS